MSNGKGSIASSMHGSVRSSRMTNRGGEPPPGSIHKVSKRLLVWLVKEFVDLFPPSEHCSMLAFMKAERQMMPMETGAG